MTTPVLVQSNGVNISAAPGATYSVSFPNPTTPGNLLVAYSCDFQNANIPTPPTGWSTAFQDADVVGGRSQILAFLPAAASTTAVTFTSTSASTDAHLTIIAEFAGSFSSSPLDTFSHSLANRPQTNLSFSATTSFSTDLVLGCFLRQTPPAGTFTAGTGFTPVLQELELFMEFGVATSQGPQTATATMATSSTWGGGIACFALASGTAGMTGVPLAGC